MGRAFPRVGPRSAAHLLPAWCVLLRGAIGVSRARAAVARAAATAAAAGGGGWRAPPCAVRTPVAAVSRRCCCRRQGARRDRLRRCRAARRCHAAMAMASTSSTAQLLRCCGRFRRRRCCAALVRCASQLSQHRRACRRPREAGDAVCRQQDGEWVCGWGCVCGGGGPTGGVTVGCRHAHSPSLLVCVGGVGVWVWVGGWVGGWVWRLCLSAPSVGRARGRTRVLTHTARRPPQARAGNSRSVWDWQESSLKDIVYRICKHL